jgi:6-phosphogluconolactonase
MLLCAKNGALNVTRRSVIAGRRIVLAAIVGLAALVILSGCGSFFSSSSSASHLGFVAGGLTDVSAYRIDNNSGNASSIVTAPYVAGNSPSSVVVHPSNQFLYVANAADSTISLFSINSSSGALTEVLPRTSAGGFSPGFMTMDSGGKFLFVANQVSNDVSMFQIGAAGTLALLSTVSLGSSPAGLTLSSAGFLYVPVPNFSVIAVLNTGSGTLQFVGSYAVTTGVGGIAVDSGAKFLYATNPASNTVSVFAIQAGGGLIAMPGLTVATGAGSTPVAVALNLSGTALYVADTGSATVSQFTINSSTGVLTAFTAAAVVAGTSPAFLVVDPGGKFIFAGNTGSMSITEYSINSDESLTNTNTISVAFVPRSFAVTQ